MDLGVDPEVVANIRPHAPALAPSTETRNDEPMDIDREEPNNWVDEMVVEQEFVHAMKDVQDLP